MKALAVIDGEHYPPVVRDALRALSYEVVAAYLAGGSEKLRGDDDYGVRLVPDLEAGIAEHEPEVVVDLSDEPVLGPRERFRMASRVLALGLPYAGPDFYLEPPGFEEVQLPTLAVIGTGKRVGKTAVTGHVARLLARDRDVLVLAMGRGGPPEPELVEHPPTLEDLLERSRAGHHAASDYLETAALAGVPTIGCRRCGGGLAGATSISNVPAGLELARERAPALLLLDGSGAALPPVAADARVLVVPAHQPPELAAGFLNAYRILVSDLVVLTMSEQDNAYEDVRSEILAVKELPVVAVALRPRPLRTVAGRRVAYFVTAPPETHPLLVEHLRSEFGAAEVTVSGNLARREELRQDLERVDADVFLVELKAAAIDVVAETAVKRGAELVLADSELRPLPGEPDLDEHLRALADTHEPSYGR